MKATVHETIREDLKAYVDGELRPIRRRQLRRHVSECSDCQKEMEEMKKITQNLFATEGASGLSDPLRERLLASIAGEAGDVDRRPKPIWRRPSSWVYGGTGAVAAASVAVFAVTYASALQSQPAADSPASLPVAALAVSAPPAAAAASASDRTTAQMATVNGRTVLGAARQAEAKSVTSAAVSALPAPPSALAFHGARVHSSFGRATGSPGVFRPGHIVSGNVAAVDEGRANTVSDYSGGLNVGGNVREVDNQAQLGIQVDDVEAAGDKIADMVKADGGYVATNNLTTQDGNRIDNMTVKIPSKDFDSMIVGFSRYGTVTSKNVTGEDITDKTGDANSDEQAQIDQVVETEQKLQGKMSERRRSQLEEQLSDQRSNLAQTRARLGTLRKTAALSTLSLTLTEKPKLQAAVPKPNFWSGFGETNQAASLAFQSAIRIPIVIGIWVIALSPIWFPLALLYRYLARKQENEKRQDR